MPGAVIYLAFSFGFAWACWGFCWLILNRHLGLSLIDVTILGSFAPFLGAGLCSWIGLGATGALRFYARGLEWRMGWLVFGVAFLLPPALTSLAGLIYAWQTHAPFAFQMSWRDVPVAYLWLLVLGGPLGEEFGWSYLSDRLDERFARQLANLLLGIAWGFWHLPLFFLPIPGTLQHFMPFYMFLIFSIVLRFLFSWSYHRGNRNVLSNLLIHNGVNFGLSLVVIIPQTQERDHLRFWYFIVFSAISALILQRLAPAQGRTAGRRERLDQAA